VRLRKAIDVLDLGGRHKMTVGFACFRRRFGLFLFTLENWALPNKKIAQPMWRLVFAYFRGIDIPDMVEVAALVFALPFST
jgi:hypothetical protein